ncbi:MAG TPA: alpha/beta fold hydrolase [Caulobacteraceae bacterium]|nr:alpha/beta fold hydrolase [Caulobacteraceae bacterium]
MITHRPLTLEGFGGVRLAVQVWGSVQDPPVVLVHGGGESREAWSAVAEALAAAGRYVLAYDLRGHGDSEWARDGRYDLSAHVGDLSAVLAHLDRRPVIIGAAMGGLIALTAVGESGELQASGLILADAAISLDGFGVSGIAERLILNAIGFNCLEEAATSAAALRPHRATPSLSAITRELRMDEAGRLRWRWDPAFIKAIDAKGSLPRLKAAAAKVRLPTLIVRGAEGEVVSLESARRLRNMIEGAELVDAPAPGHLSAGDHADEFNAIVLEFLERRAPRAPLVYQEGCSARVLRDALGCFGTGVTVITARRPDGALVGLTANSFTSVSLDPPLILFCLARTSFSTALFEAGPDFAVHVLHIGQQQIANLFATSGADKFAGVGYETWETGAPIIPGALAALECTHYATHDGGDHLIIVGKVGRAHYEPQRDPLLYFRGRYRRLHFQ